MSNNPISIDVSSNEKSTRIYAHSHIVALGLNQDGSAQDVGKKKTKKIKFQRKWFSWTIRRKRS
jgi:DNA helicase TIP49 (TBP-interacting protein)